MDSDLQKKIGLITFYKDNFGSILQCYATKNVVEELGYECNILAPEDEKQHKRIPVFLHKAHRLIFIVENTIHDPAFFKRWKIAHKEPFPLVRESWDLMDEFVDKEICPVICTEEDFAKAAKDYHAFIVGSDQVWNANNKLPDYYFLKFAPDSKKIAFAVSFGTDKPGKVFLNTIRNGVEGFKKISVREESGVSIVKAVSNVEVQRIADPTVMLSADEWKEFSSIVDISEKDFILVHFLNYPSGLAVDYIGKMQKGRKVICIAYQYRVFTEKGWEYINCDPREYVAYINAADEIYTDSFHTTLFSINLSKEFYTFERQYMHGHPQTSRISDLLKRYGLEDRFIKTIDATASSNINSIKQYVDAERKETLYYLKESINKVNE